MSEREKGLKWSLSEDELLGSIILKKTPSEASTILGRTRSAIYTRMCKKGLTREHGHSKMVHCDYCNNMLKRPESWLNAHNFCNKLCFKLWRREGKKPRPINTYRMDRYGEKVQKIIDDANTEVEDIIIPIEEVASANVLKLNGQIAA